MGLNRIQTHDPLRPQKVIKRNFSNSFAEKASGICRPSRGYALDVQGHSGTIFSPDYPVPYQDDTTCVWTLYATDGDRVKLTFVDFELGKSVIDTMYSFCDLRASMDYVEIHDGKWYTYEPLGWYCGKKTPFHVYSSGRQMSIKFRAHRDGVRANKGFKAHFESVKQRKFNKLTSVFYASVLLLSMNFVITLSKWLRIHEAIAEWVRRLYSNG